MIKLTIFVLVGFFCVGSLSAFAAEGADYEMLRPKLPSEIWMNVLNELPATDLENIAEAFPAFRPILNDPYFLNQLIKTFQIEVTKTQTPREALLGRIHLAKALVALTSSNEFQNELAQAVSCGNEKAMRHTLFGHATGAYGFEQSEENAHRFILEMAEKNDWGQETQLKAFYLGVLGFRKDPLCTVSYLKGPHWLLTFNAKRRKRKPALERAQAELSGSDLVFFKQLYDVKSQIALSGDEKFRESMIQSTSLLIRNYLEHHFLTSSKVALVPVMQDELLSFYQSHSERIEEYYDLIRTYLIDTLPTDGDLEIWEKTHFPYLRDDSSRIDHLINSYQ